MGKIPKIPNEIEEILDAGEEILYGSKQSRLRPTLKLSKGIGKFVAPDSIWITNKRIIIFKPSAWTVGVTKDIQDFPYTEMVNVYQHKGFMSSRITVRMRFQPNEPIDLDFIPKGDVMRVYRIIREQLNKLTPKVLIPTCKNCGKQIDSTWVLCPHCGSKV